MNHRLEVDVLPLVFPNVKMSLQMKLQPRLQIQPLLRSSVWKTMSERNVNPNITRSSALSAKTSRRLRKTIRVSHPRVLGTRLRAMAIHLHQGLGVERGSCLMAKVVSR